jgi:hypothetical protein
MGGAEVKKALERNSTAEITRYSDVYGARYIYGDIDHDWFAESGLTCILTFNEPRRVDERLSMPGSEDNIQSDEVRSFLSLLSHRSEEPHEFRQLRAVPGGVCKLLANPFGGILTTGDLFEVHERMPGFPPPPVCCPAPSAVHVCITFDWPIRTFTRESRQEGERAGVRIGKRL